MIIKLVQGFGRLIRKETDTGVVAILDCRANEQRAFRRVVLRALPRGKVTSSITIVKKFYISVKKSSYFK